MDDERDDASWEAATVLLFNQTTRLLNSLRAARRERRIPQEHVGMGQILNTSARADMLRAVEASRWQREAREWRKSAERWQRGAQELQRRTDHLQRVVIAAAAVSVVSVALAAVAVVTLLLTLRGAAGP